MEKDYSLEILDKAIEATKRKGQNPGLEKLATANYLTGAIMQYMTTNNSQGFTRDGGARWEVEKLTPIDIEEQLLKHVIKSAAVKEKR